MNLLIINWRDKKHPRAGGAEVRLHEIYERLAQKNHDITLIASRFKNAPAEETLDGIQIVRMGSDITFCTRVFLQLPALVRRFSPDIIVEDFNKLPFFTPWRTKKPHIIQMHHLWKYSIFHESSLPAAALVFLMEQSLRFVYSRSPFMVVSKSTKKELMSYSVPASSIQIVHNGCDLAFYTPPSKDVYPSQSSYFLWIGRIQKYKGIHDALHAFHKLSLRYPQITLKIAGRGPYEAQARRWVEKHNLGDRILFLGFVSEERKKHLLQNARAVLQTSYKEGWGLTVIEANACGTPVIANDAPGLCDSVQHGSTGILYDFGNVSSLVRVMSSYLDSPEREKQLRSKCRSWAERFSWERAAEETEDILLQQLHRS
jgi:glycosyltransferase involved in cell wall biosynthesis